VSAAARFLLDTNIVSDLLRRPQGRVAEYIARVTANEREFARVPGLKVTNWLV
jgi:predicted nucleic acid-binding protein